MNALINYIDIRLRAIVALLESGTRRLNSERGQGTVEYVGLILLVSLLMVEMVAAMKRLCGKYVQGVTGTSSSEVRTGWC